MTTRDTGRNGDRPQSSSSPTQPDSPPPLRVAPFSSDAAAPAHAEDAWTIGRLLNWTTDFLKRKSAESPRLDAEVLLAHVLDCPRVQLYTHFDDEVSTTHRAAFRELVRRRAESTPVAYLVGRKEFYSLTLSVNPAVLIPRPDTETLVAEFLTRFKAIEDPRCADIGTGSGAIALACVSQHPTAAFHGTDLSVEALEVARANASRLGLEQRVRFLAGDLLEPLRDAGPFHAILSNPPYIPTGDITSLDPGVRDHEPHLALDGGGDGLRVVTRLIHDAPELLESRGHLILEIGSAQELPVRALIERESAFVLAPTIRDAANHPRVILAIRR